jgi:putative ABC transport system permease protein
LNIASENAPSTIAAITAKWKQLAPKTPFIYFFLDEAIDQQYKADVAFGRLFLYFGIFAVLIASLGLLGLTLFSTTQRTKEIAVRKVMGAAVTDIVGLLTKDMMKLILIAFVIASPVAWLAMTKWLQAFAYRISIPWWTFLLTGGIALIIAALTVSFQTIKAAVANPVKNLRAD